MDTQASKSPAANAENLATACVLCSHNCGLRVDVKDNKIVAVRPDESNPVTWGYSCNKAYAISHYVNHAQRVTEPLRKRADGSFEEISWGVALREIADKLNRIRDEHAPRSIALAGVGGQGNHSNGTGAIPFLMALGSPMFFNALAQEKTQHALVDQRLFRSRVDAYLPGDEHHSAYTMILGSNPMLSNRGSNATDSIKAIVADPERKLVVVDPRATETARRADHHLRVTPRRDAYLLLALAGSIVQQDLHDQKFLDQKTRGAEKVLRLLDDVDVPHMARISGVDEDLVAQVAREFAEAPSAAISYDLGVEQTDHSTLISYLIRVISLLTGNLGRKGGNRFIHMFGPEIPYLGKMARALESGIEAVPMFVPMGQFSPNLLPEEILSSHPDRIRALIVDAANPLASYADTNRFAEAFEALDLLVVIEPAMTETARVADYVLPTPVGYEKWEFSGFPRGVGVVPQLRPPVVSGPPNALPEVEIYFRLAREMGLVKPAPRALHRLAKEARKPLRSPFYLGALNALAATGGGGPKRIFGRTAFWLYETLGPQLPDPMLASQWFLAVGYALTRRAEINRALPEARGLRNPFAVAELVFSKLLEHPEGVLVGAYGGDDNFAEHCHYRDGRARIFQEDFMSDLRALMDSEPGARDAEFPLVLNGGMRTGWTANTILRDPSWRKGKGPHSALLMSPFDLKELGLQAGQPIRLETRRGAITIPVKSDPKSAQGHVSLPNIFDLAYPDPETGALMPGGARINSLADAQQRDPYTGCPHHKSIACRVVPVKATSNKKSVEAEAPAT